jgi:hypothetical protein
VVRRAGGEVAEHVIEGRLVQADIVRADASGVEVVQGLA